MNGATVSAEGYATASSGTAIDGTHYALTNNQVFTGDFNGDGRMDYLFFNTTGNGTNGAVQIALASSTGSNLQANVVNSIAANSWTILGTPDLNGDRKSDILFEAVAATNGQHQIVDWLMNGGTYFSSSVLGSVNATTHLLGAVDLNGDGKADLVWQDTATNQVSIWWGGAQTGATIFNPGMSLTGASIGSFLDTLQLTYANSTVSLAGVSTGASINLAGTSGNDTFDEGVQSNYDPIFDGDGGNDIYKLGLGYQAFTIVNGLSTNAGPTGTLQIGGGIIPANLWFSKASNGNDLIIQIMGTTSSVTIAGWFLNDYSKLASLMLSDGSSITTAEISALEAAMANYQNANSSFNPSAAGAGMPTDGTLLEALTTDWSRTINVSAGGLTDAGVYGNDTFITGSGDLLTGGAGQNVYDLLSASNSNMTITDFKVGVTGDAVMVPSGTNIIVATVDQGDFLVATASGVEVVTSGGVATQYTGPVGYTLAATGDFLGPGRSATLWVNGSGQLDLMSATGTGFNAVTQVGNGVPTGAKVLATADFNDDGTTDVLWGVTSGNTETLYESISNGSGGWSTQQVTYNGVAATVTVGSSSASYSLLSTMDQNDDGMADLLWQVTTSAGLSLATWTMNGATVSAEGYATVSNGASITALTNNQVFTGDFNGDGRMDYLFFNTTGNGTNGAVQIALASSMGSNLQANVVNSIAANSWTILGTPDLNGDGKSDILFEKVTATGGLYQIGEWLMNGGAPLSTAVVGSVNATTHLLGAVDLNSDGKADLVWQDAATDQVSIWWGGAQTGATIFNPGVSLTGASIGSFLDTLQLTYGTNSSVSLAGVSAGASINYALPSASGSDTTITAFKVGVGGDALTLPSGTNITGTTLVEGDLLVANTGGFEVITSGGATRQFAGPGSGWTLAATGNFLGTVAGTVRSATLWVNGSGQLDLMSATGTGFNAVTQVGNGIPTGAKVLATADFNDDGTTDVLWGVTSGNTETLYESISNGSGGWSTQQVTYNGVAATVTVGSSSASYSLLSTMDQNDDGMADLLWQVTTSAGLSLATWTMNGATVSAEGYATVSNGASITALTNNQVFTGDFNGDGRMDYLFFNTTGNGTNGAVQIALANSGAVGADLQANVVNSASANTWTILGTPDLNGDGKSDILFEKVTATGGLYQIGEWLMNGGAPLSTAVVGSVNATTHLLGAVDLNSDGQADLVWQDAATDQVSIWWGGAQTGATIFNPGVSLTGASIGSFLDTLQLTYGTNSTVSLAGVTSGSSLNFAGTTANDTFDEGLQSGYSAIFDGNGGNDTYKFGLGYQTFTIVNGLSTDTGPTGTLQLGAGITPDDLWFTQVGKNLVVDLMGTTQSVTISNWFADPTTTSWEQLQHIAAGGETIDNVTTETINNVTFKGINSLIQAMATFDATNGTAFDPTAVANAQITDPTVLTAVTSAWHH